MMIVMIARPIAYLGALMCTALTACAGLDTYLPNINPPDLAAETQRQETDALDKLSTDTGILLNVGWPVLTANTELCPKTRRSIGIKTHRLKSYPKRLRSAAGRVLGADETPRIFHVADGSPAALAGFKRGDIIVDANNEIQARGGESWDATLDKGLVTVRRGKDILTLPIEAVMACDYNLKLSSSSAINAYADGRNITVTTSMIDFVQSDDELALIIGHELGHNTMGHIRKIVGNYIFSLGGTRYSRPFESEADYVGLYYLVRAGYSPENVEDFWQRLSKISPKGINRAKTHPTFPDRYLRIAAARKEIQAKQAAGTPLIPNFKTKSDPSDTS